ncbi:MAG: hypothetical protein LWW86_01225 [Micrococcales bacterium]|nr:hypothetical protein [Micrococcales bacterium]
MTDQSPTPPTMSAVLDRLVRLGLTGRQSAERYAAESRTGSSRDPLDIAFEVLRWQDGRALEAEVSSDEETHLRDPQRFFEDLFALPGDRVTDLEVAQDDVVTVDFAVDGQPRRLRFDAPMELTDLMGLHIPFPTTADGSPQLIDVSDDDHGLRYIYADPDAWRAFVDWIDGRA